MRMSCLFLSYRSPDRAPPENWGFRGGGPASEVGLDFEIKV